MGLREKLLDRQKESDAVIKEKDRFARKVCDDLAAAIKRMWDTDEEDGAQMGIVLKVSELAGELKFICDDLAATLRIVEMNDAQIKLDGARQAREKLARERKLRSMAEAHDRRARLEAAEAEKHCSCPDCNKPRAFFDEDGAGYCKRHADEKGIRPKGKVT